MGFCCCGSSQTKTEMASEKKLACFKIKIFLNILSKEANLLALAINKFSRQSSGKRQRVCPAQEKSSDTYKHFG
jgi:hypothetical protein